MGDATKPVKVAKYSAEKVQQALDDLACTHLAQKHGYAEDTKWADFRLFWSVVGCAAAAVAHYYPLKFPANTPVLIGCLAAYGVASLSIAAAARWAHASTFDAKPNPKRPTKPLISYDSRIEPHSDRFTLSFSLRHAAAAAGVVPPPVEKTFSYGRWVDEDGIVDEV
jgi:hypothetical protein